MTAAVLRWDEINVQPCLTPGLLLALHLCMQYGTHYKTYVNNTNSGLANATDNGVKLSVPASNLTGADCR